MPTPNSQPADPDHDHQLSTVDWDDVPEPIRLRVADILADAVGGMSTADIPPQIRQVAKFAPAKRASLGGRTLLAVFREVPEFQDSIRQWARERKLEDTDISDDPVASAAISLILGKSDAQQHIDVVAARIEDVRVRAELDTALRKVDHLEAEVTRLQAVVARSSTVDSRLATEHETELAKLRKKIREQGVAVRAAKDHAESATAELQRVREEVVAQIKAITAERDRERHRAEAARDLAQQARTDADAARQAAREARQADEVRLALLVDTMEGAVTGLRQELSLGQTGPRPADLVSGASAAQGTPAQVQDSAVLDRLLSLPSVHLIVDGYNVTKTGYPELSLSDQRERLIRQLAVLSARSGAEVTVVFDGAGVVVVPPSTPRGVRVLFSDPGVLADDVIRALVAAEPAGRPVLVATTDKAVVESIRRNGAYAATSTLLLKRLVRI